MTTLPKLLHTAADRLEPALRPLILRSSLLARGWVKLLDAIVARQSDRRVMRKSILPALAAAGFEKVLFVGTRGYTQAYGRAFRNSRTEYWTSDVDPEAARYGADGRHITCDVREIDTVVSPASFDLVVLNGIFGWGVDDTADMDRAVRAICTVLADGGFLLIGWNHDRSPDPESLPAMAECFAAAALDGLPARQGFADVTHVYCWYRKR